MQNKFMTINELCISADNNPNDITHLNTLIQSISKNIDKYKQEELEFIREHFNEKIKNIPDYHSKITKYIMSGEF